MNSQMMNEKYKILQWVIKWLKHPADAGNNSNIEVTDLASLLQCLGFTLNSFEKSLETTSLDIIETSVLKIEITCLESGMRATMSKVLAKCLCPSKEEAHNAKIWNVSGQGPANTDKVNISNSSILPNVSPSKNRVIGDLLQKVLQIINDSVKEPEDAVLKRQTSLENIKTDLSRNLNNSAWEVDPNTSPPILTSSPLPDLSHSLKLLTKSNEDKMDRLGNLLKNVIKTAEEALEVTTEKNSTFTKNVEKKRVSDIKISPLAEKSTNFINMNITRTKDYSLKMSPSPKKPLTPRKSIGGTIPDRRKMLAPPTMLTRQKAVGTSSISKIGTPPNSKPASSIRGDTPRPLGKSSIAKPKAASVPTASGENTPAGISRLRTPSRIGSLNKLPIKK